MIMELESRLIKSVNRFYAQYLLPRVIGNITNEQIATLYEIYQTDLTCNLDEFKREIARWRTRWSKTPRDQMPTSLCETLDAVNTVLYPSIDTILCIMLTMPVLHTHFSPILIFLPGKMSIYSVFPPEK